MADLKLTDESLMPYGEPAGEKNGEYPTGAFTLFIRLQFVQCSSAFVHKRKPRRTPKRCWLLT